MPFAVFTFMVFERKRPDKDTQDENPRRKKREEDFKIELWDIFSFFTFFEK